jgi:hypothetical protein
MYNFYYIKITHLYEIYILYVGQNMIFIHIFDKNFKITMMY